MLNQLLALNKSVFLVLTSLWSINIIRPFIFLFADAPIFILPLFLVWFWIFYTTKKNQSWKEKLLLIFYATVVAIILNMIIQKFVHMDRPEVFAKSVGHLLLNHVPDASFPSDHASVGIAFATALFLFDYASIGYIVLPLIIIMLFSRVIGGIHWPLDIFGWTIIGIVSAFLIKSQKNNKLVEKLNKFILKLTRYIKL